MKNTTAPKSNATANPDVLLNLLRRVSKAYDAQAEILAEFDYLRREVGRLSIAAGNTYQRTGDAMNRDRSTAHILINGRAA